MSESEIRETTAKSGQQTRVRFAHPGYANRCPSLRAPLPAQNRFDKLFVESLDFAISI
jgi:hypothetical protein